MSHAVPEHRGGAPVGRGPAHDLRRAALETFVLDGDNAARHLKQRHGGRHQRRLVPVHRRLSRSWRPPTSCCGAQGLAARDSLGGGAPGNTSARVDRVLPRGVPVVRCGAAASRRAIGHRRGWQIGC
jgi:hypothetical protein